MQNQTGLQTTKKEQLQEVAKVLDGSISGVFNESSATGFMKAYVISDAIDTLKSKLTPEYMQPIMQMQGMKLGFRTDKDRTGGYPMEAVRECLIEAVLLGLQPYGNQFNIIAGNMYVTKEGSKELLKKIKGLKYSVIPGLPRFSNDMLSAAVPVKLKWEYGGVSNEENVEIPVKLNSGMGPDAAVGKATRKARMLIYNNISETELSDSDEAETLDVDHEEVPQS